MNLVSCRMSHLRTRFKIGPSSDSVTRTYIGRNRQGRARTDGLWPGEKRDNKHELRYSTELPVCSRRLTACAALVRFSQHPETRRPEYPLFNKFEKYSCGQVGCGVAEIRDEDLGKREESLVTTVNNTILTRLGSWLLWSAVFVASLGAGQNASAALPKKCADTITANVVVLDNPTIFNRLGAQNPNWMMYALKRDVVHKSSASSGSPNPKEGQACELPGDPAIDNGCTAGNVELRRDKRPRPLVVRSVEGACLTVNFENYLAPVANPNNFIDNPLSKTDDILKNNDQVAGRCAGFHATGTELVTKMADDGSMVGKNEGANDGDTNNGDKNCGPGMAAPDESRTYNLYTPHEGAFIINSYGATIGSEQSGGNLGIGLFGALNVEPKNARIYRSQVTEEEMRLATTGFVDNDPNKQPIINYDALYPNVSPWKEEGKGGLPILRMVTGEDGRSGQLVHSDINAIISGPDADGSWRSVCPGDDCPYPLESVGRNNPQLPNRIEAFREFASIFHDEQTNTQVFPKWYGDPVIGYTLDGVGDAFMINYGSGGIGSEIIANRLHAGPMHDCTDCAYEEFFLASQVVGDPALLVKYPANTGIEQCDPNNILDANCWRQFNDDIPGEGIIGVGANPPIPGNEALYQEDPSNVHNAYIGDYTKIRNIHAGAFEQHIFHLHNQQWLFNPNDDNANYLDAQEIMPGSGHTYELVNGGAGNRNKTSGDAIFHCHFYPHFAQGMWYHIRILDTFQRGTVLDVSNADDSHSPALYEATNVDGSGKPKNFHSSPWGLKSGKPAQGARALPDGELLDGSPIPAIVPLPGKPMAPMPAEVSVAAVDRGDFGVLSGRRGPNGLGQGPDSSQAIIDLVSMAGPDGILFDDLTTPNKDEGADDRTPGYPFHLAGNNCGFVTDGAGKLVTATGGVAGEGLNCPEGTVGQRMPTPVLDLLTEEGAKHESMPGGWEKLGGGWDGGLPRHNLRGYTSGGLSLDTQNRLDFRKVMKSAAPVYFPETGTEAEKVAMAYHADRFKPSEANLMGTTDTKKGNFLVNGSAPVPGGPYQDPCIDDTGAWLETGVTGQWYDGKGNIDSPDTKGNALLTRGGSPYGADNPRTYKIANVQIDAVFNKVGHHYSQERIIALWDDVAPLINKQRPPEPLVMRFNTFDCGKILHANLVPAEFEVDDFQVRTPTDIIGQHIHLPKWDLTTNDGAANGWNYEDGTLAPLMVQERIAAINTYNKLAGGSYTLFDILTGAGLKPSTPTEPGDFHMDLVPIAKLHTVDMRGLEAVPTIDTGDPAQGDPMAGYVTEMGGSYDYRDGLTTLEALPHPFFENGEFINGHWEYKGARTTIQRILVDPVVNVAGVDRGLGLTFSHDHYGPSTFQQIGLYSTILAEPAGSTWYHNESKVPLNTRHDGGPTTWQAAIITADSAPDNSNVGAENVEDHREFYFEMSDFQHAYNAGTYVGAKPDGRPKDAEYPGKIPQIHVVSQPSYFDATKAYADTINGTWREAVNPTLKLEAHKFPDVVTAEGGCPGPGSIGPNGEPAHPTNNDPNVPRPCAEAINLGHSSTWVINYRNEPLGLRVFDPSKTGPDGKNGAQAAGPAGDLALAFSSSIERAIPELNTRFGNTPAGWQDEASYCSGGGDEINCDRGPGDPFTPIMRAQEGDQVKVKIQVGATEEQHQTTVHGIKWLSNGSGFGRSPNSGWRNFQSHGISEQFSLQAPMNPALRQAGQTVDYLYATDATRPGMWLGTWGILRTYGQERRDLYPLPNNDMSKNVSFVNARDFNGVCPKSAPVRNFDIAAVLANDVLPNNLGVTIPSNLGNDPANPVPGDTDGDGTGDNAGGPLNPLGGTLVYNRRGTNVPDVTITEAGVETSFKGGDGPLNDPTAMMYVLNDDLIPVVEQEALDGGIDGPLGSCLKTAAAKGRKAKSSGEVNFDASLPDCAEDAQLEARGCMLAGAYNSDLATCAAKLRPQAPVEPLVIRANAGDCIEIQLRNRLVTRQGVTKDGEKVFYGDGRPAMHDDGKGDLYYVVGPAGEQVEVLLADIEFFRPPDLSGWQDMMWGVTRRVQDNDSPHDPVDDEMYFFNNNLIAPSGYAGIHTQLVEYDASRDDGLWVGKNQPQIATPGGSANGRYYAGHLEYVPRPDLDKRNSRALEIVPTPIEFGGSNLLSADRIKQPQKGLFGALVIEPKDAKVDATTMVPDGQGKGSDMRETRIQATVTAETPADYPAGSGGTYREALAIGHKIGNIRWKDGRAIKNLHQGELGREGAEDSGHAGFNYGMEPSWFRFQLPPDVPFGAAKKDPNGNPVNDKTFGSVPNPQAMYSNKLVKDRPNAVPFIDGVSAAGDPAIPVLMTTAGTPTRMYVLNGASADRDGTFVLHGHLWQRDPYVCPGEAYLGLEGYCEPTSIGSHALGTNPLGKYMGGEEGMGHVYGHWPILFNAGGTHEVAGDYLFRDYTPSGNRNGQFGILRVEETP